MADKFHFIAIILILLLPLLWVANEYNLFKPVNPANPLFNPEHFSFEDYHQRDLLDEALRKSFPVETPVEFVDKVMLEYNGYKRAANSHPQARSYSFHVPYAGTRTQHTFVFDKNMKLINIHSPSGAHKLYQNQQGHRDILGWTEEQKRNN